MSVRAGTIGESGALSEVMGLLGSGAGSPNLRDGYLDFLGDRDPLGRHISHRVFHTDLLPRVYERWWRPLFERVLFGWWGSAHVDEEQIVLGMVEVAPEARLLDVGCGPGNWTRRFARETGGRLVVGCDAAAKMLAAAAEEGGSDTLAYVRADATELPFEDGSFDAVTCIAAIHMVKDPFAGLDEIVRVLAPGGCLALLASCNWKKGKRAKRRGMYVFERDELTSALAERGLEGIKQQVAGRAQFVGARKPAE